MAGGAHRLLDTLDDALGGLARRLSGENGVLLSIVFHSLVHDEEELRAGKINPDYAANVSVLDETINHLLNAGYNFVNAADLVVPSNSELTGTSDRQLAAPSNRELARSSAHKVAVSSTREPARFSARALDTRGRYAFLTFDDGYANQRRALPVLSKHGVPATFFLATGYIDTGACFWWDVLYRNLAGADRQRFREEYLALRRLAPAEVTHVLEQRFGEAALQPEGELDRPLTIAEVKELAESPFISFGNHTRDHAILSALSTDAAAQQVTAAGEDLIRWTGRAPSIFAYPDGVVDARFGQYAARAGVSLAFTVEPRPTRLPLATTDFRVGRFSVPSHGDVGRQIRIMRAPWSLRRVYRSLAQRYARERQRHA